MYSLGEANCLYRVRHSLTSWAHRICTPLQIKTFDEGEWKTKGVCVFCEPYFRVLKWIYTISPPPSENWRWGSGPLRCPTCWQAARTEKSMRLSHLRPCTALWPLSYTIWETAAVYFLTLTSSLKKPKVLQNGIQILWLGRERPKQRIMDMGFGTWDARFLIWAVSRTVGRELAKSAG
jgi:hypothetical protein